jgi:hypothetical protein
MIAPVPDAATGTPDPSPGAGGPSGGDAPPGGDAPAIITEPPKEGVIPVLLRFFVVPLILVGASLGVFALLGALVAQGDPSSEDLLQRLLSGGTNARWHAAQELSNRVAQGEIDLAADGAFVAGVVRAAGLVLDSGDDPRVFEHLSVFLAASRDPAALDVLRRGAVAPDPDVRLFAVTALARHGDPSSLGAVLERLGDSDPVVRSAAAWSAGSLCRTMDESSRAAAREPLGRALADPDLDVRMNAALAAGRNGWPEAGEMIWKMLHPGWIRERLAGDEGGLRTLLRPEGGTPVTREQREDGILLNALTVVYALKDRSMIEGVRGLAQSHRSPQVQGAAMEVLRVLQAEVDAGGSVPQRSAPTPGGDG